MMSETSSIRTKQAPRRSKSDITFAVLNSLAPSALTKAEVKDKTKVNYHQLNERMNSLIAGGFIQTAEGSKKYSLSDAGNNYLEAIKAFRSFEGAGA